MPDGSTTTSSGYLGRASELAELAAALEQASAGRGRLLLFSGEPGIGKTALLEQAAAAGDGMDVVWGRCWQGAGAPAFWPWIQVLRGIAEARGTDAVRSLIGPRAVHLTPLVPELAVPDAPEADLASESARFELFDTLASLLVAASRRRPLLLLLDDLHWADYPSVLLLHFVAQRLAQGSVLVCATYRELEVEQDPALAEAIRSAARHSNTIALRGLDDDAIAELVESRLGTAPEQELLRRLAEQTEGNPFFVDEVARALLAEGDLTGSTTRLPAPETVLEVIRRRVATLDGPTLDLLQVAAVQGIEFDLRALAEAAGLDVAEVTGALEGAERAHAVVREPDAPDRARFRHALVREALYEELAPERRRQLHRAVAEAMEREPGAGERSADLAHHRSEAGDVAEAYVHTKEAAHQASRRLAFEESVRLLQRAQGLARLVDPDDESEQLDLLLALAEAQERGDDPESEQTYLEAAELARLLGDHDRRARALIGMGADILYRTYAASDERRVALVRETLDELDEGDSIPRAVLSAQLAVELTWSAPIDERDRLSTEALAMARRLGDPTALTQTLNLRCQVLTSSADIEAHLATAEDLIVVADESGSERSSHRGRYSRIHALLRAGRHSEAETEIDRLLNDVGDRGDPRLRFAIEATRAALAIHRGAHEEGSRLAAEAMELGASTASQIVNQVFGVQASVIAWDTGRMHEAVDAIAEQVRAFPGAGSWMAALAWASAEVGRMPEARRVLEQLEETAFRSIQQDLSYTAALSGAAMSAGRLGERNAAVTLYELLLPFDGSLATAGGIGHFGPVSYALGLLAATMGRHEDAERHLRDAIEMSEGTGGRPSLARAQLALGRLLRERGRPEDSAEAASLLAASRRIATELGMAGVLAELDELQPGSATEQADARAGAPGQPAPTRSGLWRDRYEPLAVLGEGGQGKVMRAHDHQHDRTVALKVRPVGPSTDRNALLAEARVLLNLKPHPGVTLVREDFFHEDSYVMVMEWIEGTDLATLLAERGDPGLPLETVIAYLGPVAAALDHLHSHRPAIVHGDVKPANLILTPTEAVVLVDFGVSSSGEHGSVAGSPGYRAPEVAADERATPAADIYGLAATAHTLLAGRPPTGSPASWEGLEAATIGPVERALRRGLSSDPARRPGSARELLERLRAARASELPSGVITFLLTDIESSTVLWDAHPRAMEVALERHDHLVAEAVEEAGGTLIRSKGEGDSTFSVFARASDAVTAAISLQRAIAAEPWAEDIELRVRASVHTGEAQVRAGDYFGGAVNRAARLRGLATGGQVLLSQTTAQVVTDALSEGMQVVELGPQQLRGLRREEVVYELRHPELDDEGAPAPKPEPTPPSPRIPLPPLLAAQPVYAFVGREHELERMNASLESSREGTHLLLLAGEPGVGKSRLASEFARSVHEEGALVLAGRCDEGLAVPYQPFVEALRWHVDHTPDERLRDSLGRWPEELARLVPDLADGIPDLPPPLSSEPEFQRWRLFEAVASWLAAASTERPLLLVLDDLHWATAPTIQLLRHVTKPGAQGRVLVLATYRDTDIEPGHPLADALGDLQRDGGNVLGLEGLATEEVEAFMCEAAGHDLDAQALALAASIHQATGGVPLFVGEILRHLAETGGIEEQEGRWTTTLALDDLEIPQVARDVIARRLDRLDEDVQSVLRVMSVAGEEAEVAVLDQATEAGGVLDGLETAASSGLVREEGAGRFRFTHALIRQALYQDIGATRRAHLHTHIAEAIERVHADHLDHHLAALAHHYLAAADPRALDYAIRAGEQALTRHANDEAVRYFEQALSLATDSTARCDLLIRLGEAQRRAGDPAFRDTLLGAAELAETMGDGERMVRATSATHRGWELWVDDRAIRLLEVGLESLPVADSPMRARALSLLASRLTMAHQSRDRRVGLSDEALAMARRIGDLPTLGFVLATRYEVIWAPETLEERLSLVEELLDIARRCADPNLEATAHTLALGTHLQNADAESCETTTRELSALAEDLGQPLIRWVDLFQRAMQVLDTGDLERAEAMIEEAFDIGRHVAQDALLYYVGQLFWLRWEQGRLEEIFPLFEHVTDAVRPVAESMLARIYTETGQIDEARRLLVPVAASDFSNVPRDLNWIICLANWSHVVVEAGDRSAAATLYDLLHPFSEQVVGGGGLHVGPVSFYLGLLARTLGRSEQAEHWFAKAVETCGRIRSIWGIRTQQEWARMLVSAPLPDALPRARELIDESLRRARTLELPAATSRGERLLARLPDGG